MTEDIRICMPACAAAPGFARTLLVRRLKKWGYSHISDDATLITAELVTNAVKATPEGIIRFLCRWEHGSIYIAVWDPSPGRPAPALLTGTPRDDPADLASNGNGHRGLRIVDALALEWGYRPDPVDPSTGRASPGKWVWARVAADPPATIVP